ncbi:MAG: hypothetical protein ABI857_00265 [Acidobacteriota bacterium]
MTNIQYLSGAINPGDCIGGAWTLVTRRFWLYIGVALVTILMIGCIPFVGSLLFGPVLGGFYYLVLRDMRDEPVDFGMMFKGFEKFLPLMLAGLVQTAPSLIATILQYTVDIARLVGGGARGGDINFYQPGNDAILAGFSVGILVLIVGLSLFGAVWSIALSFAVPLILEHDLGVVDALVTSAKAALNNAGGLIVLVILQILVGILGVIALCIGIFVAIPVIYTANVFAYRLVFPYFDRPDFKMAPPPPTEYGGTYGTNY